jgi:predicted transglutaminase-like cysteine proteinase
VKSGHAVLAVAAPNGPVILDVLSKEITPAGFDTAAMIPVIGVNETGWWFYQKQ